MGWEEYFGNSNNSSGKDEEEYFSGGNEIPVGTYEAVPAETNSSEQPYVETETPAEAAPLPPVTDAHYSPQYFIDEQKNRLNPEYQSPDADKFDNAMVDGIANMVLERQKEHPEKWKDENGNYTDAGWDAEDPIWLEYVKPYEDEYQTKAAQQQTQAVQADEVQSPSIRSGLQTSGALDTALQTSTGETAPQGTTMGGVSSGLRTTPKAMPNENIMDTFNRVVSSDPKYARGDSWEADYDKMKLSEKIMYWLTPSLAGTDIKNAPEKSKYTQSVLSSAFSAGGPAAAAAIVTGLLGGPAGWVGLAVGGSLFGYNYTKSIGLHEGIDAVDKVTEWSDWGDPIGQELWGNLSYALYQTTGGELSDPAQFFTNIKTVLEHPKEIWNAMPGKNDEYNSTVTDAVLKMSSNIGADAFGNFMSRFIVNSLSALVDEDPYRLERGHTTRANQGLTGVYTPEYYGAQAQQLLLDLGMDLYNQGVTDEADLEYLLSLYVTREYGDISNISEFTEHELADVANLAEGMTPRAIGAYADVIGDTNLKTAAAASTGSLAGDILDNVPILPDVVRQIGRMTGHNNWLETSGSYQDVFAQWNVENLTNSTDQLTNLDRRFSGITKDNKLKGGIFTPNANPNSVKNPFAKGAIAFKNLFSYTNEYKAAYEGDQIFDYITIGIEDALRARPTDNPDDALMRVRQFIDEIANPELIEKGSPFYENAQSVLFNSIRDDLALAVRQNRQSIDKIIQKYELQQKPRAALNALSEALGLQPSKVLDMYDNHKTILTQMIVDEAEKNGGKLPGIDLDVTGREFGEQVIQMIAPFSAKGGEAWNVRQIVAQMSSTIADGVTDTIINKYGIQPEGFMYRFGDMIKKMQNLVLLGLSPSYLANNFVNNVATRTALGYGGWMSPNQINSWMDRFGYTPERFKESITGQIEGKTGDSNYEKLNAAIRNEKQKVDGTGFKKNLADAMKKVGDAGSWASNTFGIFGNLSGKVESMESQQIITKAMMTYMARTWKPGINFRKMPAQLEAAIRAINPGMVDAIYKAISAGMNMEEIESAIYGTYVAPSVQDNLLEAATNLGIDNPDDVVTEYFIGSGLYAQLNEALKGKRGEEIDKVVDQFAEHLKSVLSFQMATDLSARSEAVAKDVNNTNSPFITATEHANNMADQMLDVWLKGQNLNQNIFMRRLREDMDPIAFHKMYQQHQKNLNERWKNVYATAEQTYDGITKGLGFGDKNRRNYLKAMNKKNQAWIKFYNETQPKAFQVYLDAIEWRLDDTWTKVENGKRIPGTWETRTEKAWETYRENITKAIKDVYTEEAKQQKAMDAAFLAGLKDAVGNIKSAEVDTVIAPQLEAIQNKRNEIIEQNRKVREIADNTKNLDKKNDAWNEASEKLKELEGEYYKLQQQMYADVRGMASFATNVTADNETDHEANIQTNAAQEKAEKNQKTAKEVADRLVDRILKGEDELNNLTPDNWSEFLRRDSLREVALKAGATKEQADAYARLVGAYAKAWERKNPGKDFFTDHLNMRVEGYDVGVTLEDADIQRVKGQFKIEDGEKVVQLFRGSDFSTLVHETMGHGFSTTLDEAQIEALAAYNGWTVRKYKQLENQFYYDFENMSEADRTAWVDAQERFAYGFEQYLLEGKAPNIRMMSVFEAFRKFLMEIYQGIRDLVYKGEAIDIHKKQNGVTLAQIFDSMLDGYRGQKETIFNITGRENLTDVSNSYTDVSQTLSDGTPVSANYTLPENARRFFLSDAERRKVQVEKIQQARMDETLTAVSEYVAGAEQRWNLTPDESAELAKEMMHAIGLALGEEENEALKHSLQVKMTKTERHNIRKFVNEHRLDAVTTDADVIDAELGTTGSLGEDDADYSFGYNIPFDDSVYQTGENQERAAEARRAEAEKKLQRGEFVPVKDIDLTKIEPSGRRDEAAKKMAQSLMDLEAENVEEGKRHSFEDWIAYIYDSKDGKGNPILSDEEKKKMTATRTMAELQKGINNDSQIHAIKANRLYTEKIPRDGTYAARTFGYEYGEHEIVGIVSHNGRVVAYVPKVFPLTEVEVEGNRTVKILGVSPNSPSLLVYLDGDQVKTESIPVDPVENPHSGEMEAGAMPAIDPVPQAHNQVAYEKIFDMMEEFKRVYKQNIDNALTDNKFSELDDKTRADLREYIDTFVRQDLMNTKFKTGKFGEIVRDAALLNYSKRIGLDNFLTLLCPYQFWNTRSFLNWAGRIGSKGGKLWRRYARLKEVEERNRKEYMPSRVSGMFGIYVPGLPNEYGDALFVSADQKLIVPNFLDPIIEQRETHNAVIATAERLLQEMKDEDSITFAEYQAAMNPATREQSPAWKEALAKAKLAEGHDNDFADLTRKYLGLNLPMSIMKAVKTGDPADWNQYPMTRLGTAARAVVGNNWIGRGIEDVLSAPERALRTAVTRMTGDDTFAYNEFGAFGDKYIRGKVFDMVVEGKISPEEALQASIEKDGNKIWEEAADRQREEVLLKIQGGSVADAVKKLGKSIFSNDESGDSFKDNFYYLLASIATAPDSKQFVGPAEQTWRERSAELSATYDNNDKESRDQFYKDYPEHRYNSLRWEDNDELALRKYAYNSIMQNYYGMDPADREIVKMSFDSDFNKYVINSKTRAIESMDLNKLVGYAQALNGKVPFISTDKLDTSKANKYNIMQVPETEKSAYNLYISERDRLFPGMSDVNNLYYKLDPADRQTFKKANPKLAQYQEWNDRYKNEHQDVKQFIKRRSSYYDTVEAENACAQFSILTMKELNRVALADKMPNEIYKREIEQVMAEVGTSKDYEWFIRNIKNYILGL